MEKKREKVRRKNVFPAGILFLCGFFLGTLLPNLAWRLEWKQKTMASIYLLGVFADRSVSGREYLLEVLRMRGSWFLLCVLCGFSVFGVPVSVAAVVLQGLFAGAILTMSVLQFGLSGGAVGLSLLLPQYLLYVPAVLYMMAGVYCLSMAQWKNRGLFPGRVFDYLKRAGVCILLYAAGILLEVYVNPWVAEKVLDTLKFFRRDFYKI